METHILSANTRLAATVHKTPLMSNTPSAMMKLQYAQHNVKLILLMNMIEQSKKSSSYHGGYHPPWICTGKPI
eukprot:1180104-Karenia_brevis.AAC.1